MYDELGLRLFLLVLLAIGLTLTFIGKKLLKTSDARKSVHASVVLLILMLISPSVPILLSHFGVSGQFADVEIINLFSFFGVITIIVATQALGIVMMGFFDERAGTIFMAIFGGIASSTTLTQLFGLQSRKLKGSYDDKTFGAISVIANGSSMIEKFLLIGAASSPLLKVMLPFLLAHGLIGIIIGVLQMQKVYRLKVDHKFKPRYFSVTPIIVFAGLYFFISIANQFIYLMFEQSGKFLITGVSYLGGLNIALLEISARSLKDFSLETGMNLLLLAFVINIFTKIFSAATLGTKIYLKWVTFGLLTTLILSLLIQYFYFYILP